MSTILNIFTPLYSWCTSLGDRLQTPDEYISYYQNYFAESSVCSHVFGIAVLIALVIASIYYFVFCNISFRAAKRYIWLIVLGVCFLATLIITPSIIVGHYDPAGLRYGNNNTRLFDSAKCTLENNLSFVEDDEAREGIIQIAEDYASRFRGSGTESPSLAIFTMQEEIPLQMSVVNGFYCMLVFFCLSILFKRFTIHSKAIPF